MLSRFVLVEGNRLCVKSPEVPSSLHGKTNKCAKSINANASHRDVNRKTWRGENGGKTEAYEQPKRKTRLMERVQKGGQFAYARILVGIMDHPTLFKDVGAASFRVLDRLNDAHQRDVVAHSRTVVGRRKNNRKKNMKKEKQQTDHNRTF